MAFTVYVSHKYIPGADKWQRMHTDGRAAVSKEVQSV